MVVFFWHCGGTLTSWYLCSLLQLSFPYRLTTSRDYFVATAAIYVPCWAYPWLRTLFEYGIGQKARLFVEENGFTRVTIPANSVWQPGQHCFLRFPSFGIHAVSSHPFTMCSLPSTSSDKRSEMVFYIRPRRGFTARLHNYAMTRPGVQVPVLVDGPYGGIDNQKYFGSDRLVVFAGGSGAGWMLPFVEQFLLYLSLKGAQKPMAEEPQDEDQTPIEPRDQQQAPRGPRSLRVILATRDVATRTWFHTALNDLLSRHGSLGTPSNLHIEVHLTGEAERTVQPPAQSASELERSGSSSEEDAKGERAGERKEFNVDEGAEEEVRGRPHLPSIIREEAVTSTSTGQTVAVFVCGPLSMQDDARNAVARENLSIVKNPSSGGMYLHLEHFSWA